MGISADLVATTEGNKRNELDAYGLESLADASALVLIGVAVLVERVAS